MMIKLLKNELYKLFRTKKLYVFAAIILAVLMLNLYNYQPGSESTIWTFTHGQSAPLVLINILSQFMVIFIPIFIGDSIANEYRQGTLKLSLLRSITRSQLMKAKIASLFVFISIMVLFFIIASYVIGTYFLGWGNGTEYAGQLYTPIEGVLLTLGANALLILPYMAYGMFVISIAVLSSNMSLAVISSLVIMTIGLNLNVFESIALYSLAYHIVYFHESFVHTLDWQLALQSTGIIAIYLTVFSVLSFCKFKKKEILY
ncbi:MAG TPA: ABC transporter permease subunit [Clostridiales bacterium]|nr:ABC transporter permease subunit [Clostridiales bacterium]